MAIERQTLGTGTLFNNLGFRVSGGPPRHATLNVMKPPNIRFRARSTMDERLRAGEAMETGGRAGRINQHTMKMSTQCKVLRNL